MLRMKIAIGTCVAAVLIAAAIEGQDRLEVPPLEVPPPPRPEPATQTEPVTRPQFEPVAESQADPETTRLYRVSEILGMPVRDAQGRDIGAIRDLVVDGHTQQVQYFILSGGRTVDAQNKLFVMPWAVAEPQFAPAEHRHIVVELPPEQLRQAPVFTPQQRHGVEWTTQVDRFYNVPPQRYRVLRPDFDRDDDDDEDEDLRRLRGRGPFPVPPRDRVRIQRDDDDD